jgi:hypothetical protein
LAECRACSWRYERPLRPLEATTGVCARGFVVKPPMNRGPRDSGPAYRHLTEARDACR